MSRTFDSRIVCDCCGINSWLLCVHNILGFWSNKTVYLVAQSLDEMRIKEKKIGWWCESRNLSHAFVNT